MGFSPFTYWQRGKKTKQPLTRPKKGDSHPLILQMIEHGNFDISPWENMIGEEYEMLEQDVEDYKDKNPRSSFETVRNLRRDREWVYSKRIKKLREAHMTYEITRMKMLDSGMRTAFGNTLVDRVMVDGFEGGAREFYETCVKYRDNLEMWNTTK